MMIIKLYVPCVNVLQITDFNGKIIVYGCMDLAFPDGWQLTGKVQIFPDGW
jgi:hypothetical protein